MQTLLSCPGTFASSINFSFFFAFLCKNRIKLSIITNNSCCQTTQRSNCEHSFEFITSECSAELRESRKVCVYYIKNCSATHTMQISRGSCQCCASGLSIDWGIVIHVNNDENEKNWSGLVSYGLVYGHTKTLSYSVSARY